MLARYFRFEVVKIFSIKHYSFFLCRFSMLLLIRTIITSNTFQPLYMYTYLQDIQIKTIKANVEVSIYPDGDSFKYLIYGHFKRPDIDRPGSLFHGQTELYPTALDVFKKIISALNDIDSTDSIVVVNNPCNAEYVTVKDQQQVVGAAVKVLLNYMEPET